MVGGTVKTDGAIKNNPDAYERLHAVLLPVL